MPAHLHRGSQCTGANGKPCNPWNQSTCRCNACADGGELQMCEPIGNGLFFCAHRSYSGLPIRADTGETERWLTDQEYDAYQAKIPAIQKLKPTAAPSGPGIADIENKVKCFAEARRLANWVYLGGLWHSLGSEGLLAGEMLDQYLDGLPKPGLADKIGRAIQGSQVHDNVTRWLVAKVRENPPQPSTGPNGAALKKYAQQVVDEFRRQRPGSVYFGGANTRDQHLQFVIGGVHDIRVGTVTEIDGRFRIELIYSDVYDFENERNNRVVYDSYRKALATLLCNQHYHEFWTVYNAGWDSSPPPGAAEIASWLGLRVTNPLPKGLVVASFMYAMEQAGYTRGVPWKASAFVDAPYVPEPAKEPAHMRRLRQEMEQFNLDAGRR